jgi:F0F1-type ATP synthase membrane subunit b/b'
MRRYLQFSLRSLFLLTTLAAVACMVVPPAIERYKERQRRIAAEKAAAQAKALLAATDAAFIRYLETHAPELPSLDATRDTPYDTSLIQ